MEMMQQAVTTQPRPGGGWMSVPQQDMPNCPPGLEYLTTVDQLLAHQVVELLQAFTGWETNNRYAIKNSMGQQIFYAFEETNLCMRLCCGGQREFTIHIVDNFNKEVMRIHRPFKCFGNCCKCCANIDCCGHEVQVEAPPGTVIGRVRQESSCCGFHYGIQDAQGNTQLRIEGPCIMCRCCFDVNFPLYTVGEQKAKVGKVAKQWTGLAKEAFTVADNFGIQFPMDLDVCTKATLIGAMFLIDFMAFEQKNK